MSNEDIAKELLSVLKEKMMYREGLPSDGWAVEMICNALVAAQHSDANMVRKQVRESLEKSLKDNADIWNGLA